MILELLALVISIGGFLLLLAAYFLPSIVARRRGHNNLLAIFMTNMLLGWTLIFWVVALIWSTTDNRTKEDALS